MSQYCMIFCTCTNQDEARKIAMHLLQTKLAACINILPEVESLYLWKGELETSVESKLLIKTQQEKVNDVISTIKLHHSYDVPEIQAVPVIAGNPDYFNWIDKVIS